MNDFKMLIIILTYNEIENIPLLIPKVFSIVPSNVDILVVDDSSPDGTGNAVNNIMSQYPGHLFLLSRPVKEGTAKAYIAGFNWGLARDYDTFLQFDADFSHNPKYIPVMLDHIKNYDLVIGSRNIKGGGTENWPLSRTIISKGGSLYSRLILSCPVRDMTGGYNMWKRETLEKIHLDRLMSKSYSMQIEMKFRTYCAGCSIKEIPIIFTDRIHGISKISNNTILEALGIIWKIKKAVGFDSTIDQFIKFFITGGLGTITNLLLFFVLVDLFNHNPLLISILCYFVAGTQNYILNHKWSFRQNTADEPLSFKRWFLFLSGSLIGYIANISIMTLVISCFILPIKTIAQACGILAGMIINFVVSKLFIFKKKK